MVKAEHGIWSTFLGEEFKISTGSSLFLDHTFKDGQRVERHDDFIRWISSWDPSWSQGHILTIDYGDVFPELYHRRPKGTVRAYFEQQRIEMIFEILSRPGKQDITADIDFTDIRNRMSILGLIEIRFQTQAEFILDHSIQTLAGDPATDQQGAGQSFKVLWHQRN